MKLSQDVLAKIKQVEIYTRRLLNSALAGDSRSALKGTGFEFDQIREYQMGDDIRFIDWKASARANNILVKQYIEERSRTIILAIDCSQSTLFASDTHRRFDVIARIASVLALVAEYGKDHVGLVLFAEQVELFIPPKRGQMHVRTIMEKIFTHKPTSRGTNINSVLDFIAGRVKEKSMVFILSDFITDDSFKKRLHVFARKHDCVAIRCLDHHEHGIPAVGFLTIKDEESGVDTLIDMRSGNARNLNAFLAHRIAGQNKMFKAAGVDLLDVRVDTTFMGELVCFFRRRMMY